MPLSSQRNLFDIPRDIAYFNMGYMSPILKSAAKAGADAAALKQHPWTITPADFFDLPEQCRQQVAQLINASADDIAIVPAASYGIETAAKNIPLQKGQEIILLEEQFPSNVYPWRRKAAECGASIVTIRKDAARRQDGGYDWASAIIEKITPATGIIATANVLWNNGAPIDLERVSKAAREAGAALVLDLTQSLGAMPFDVTAIQPDFMVSATYKWMLGPYSLGFLYVAPKYQNGAPLEEGWITRDRAEDFARLADYTDRFQPGARRFDMGERANLHLLPIAHAALDQIIEWTVPAIAQTLAQTTATIAKEAEAIGFECAPAETRAAHFLGLSMPSGIPDNLLDRLRSDGVYASVRGTSIRITPHLYNDDADIERLIGSLKSIVG